VGRASDGLQIVVKDNGQGIAPEFPPYVFERFRQQDASATRVDVGLGLGLSIAKHLVELHGGTIDVVSGGNGQGATNPPTIPATAPRQALATLLRACCGYVPTRDPLHASRSLRGPSAGRRRSIMSLVEEASRCCARPRDPRVA
jgi:hypothetical protein